MQLVGRGLPSFSDRPEAAAQGRAFDNASECRRIQVDSTMTFQWRRRLAHTAAAMIPRVTIQHT